MSLSKVNVFESILKLFILFVSIIVFKQFSSVETDVESRKHLNYFENDIVLFQNRSLKFLRPDNVLVSNGNGKCYNETCISKCCPKNQQFGLTHVSGGFKVSCFDSDRESTFKIMDKKFYGSPCRNSTLFFSLKKFLNFSKNGDLLFKNDDLSGKFNPSEYCLDYIDVDSSDYLVASVCFKGITYTRGFVYLSLVFLLITSIYCGVTCNIRNKIYKILFLSHTASLVLAYFIISLKEPLTYTNFEKLDLEPFENYHLKTTIILRYLFLIFYYAGFSWTNIISYDIYSYIRTPRIRTLKPNYRKYFKYSLYGWCTPIIMLIFHIFYSLSNIHPIEDCLIIGRKSNQCNLFYGPLLVSHLVNIYFFIRTVHLFYKAMKGVISTTNRRTRTNTSNLEIKQELGSNEVNHGSNHDSNARSIILGNNQESRTEEVSNDLNKESETKSIFNTLIVCGKLFVLMGIPYIFEVVCFIFSEDLKSYGVWYLGDAVRGIQSFLVTICLIKRKHFVKFLRNKRFYPFKYSKPENDKEKNSNNSIELQNRTT